MKKKIYAKALFILSDLTRALRFCAKVKWYLEQLLT